mmetsp:Transcript_20381/g.57401  ORF Transcript_20381/g.57401 Transcript_20381/m.57401 type:complete len:166 (-) Transcript_20381:390-887(-)
MKLINSTSHVGCISLFVIFLYSCSHFLVGETSVHRHFADTERMESIFSTAITNEYEAIRVRSENYEEPTSAGALPCNTPKNRYWNILPYDRSRVHLYTAAHVVDPCDDYINASFLKSTLGTSLYIATQAPLINTISDFWQMSESSEVLARTNGRGTSGWTTKRKA